MDDGNMTEYLTILAGILGGGFAVKLLEYFRESGKNRNETYKDLLIRVEAELKEIKEENKIMRAEVDTLKEKNNHLENQIILMQSADNLYPFPMWLKSPNGTMLVINDEYVHIFNIKKSDYIGKTDVDVWGEEVGREYWNNDLKILKGKKLYVGMEKVPAGNGDWMIVKFPLKVGDIVIGLKGYAIPVSKDDMLLLDNFEGKHNKRN